MSTLEELNERGIGMLPGLIGIEVVEAEKGGLEDRLELRRELMAPNGATCTPPRSSPSPTPPAATAPS